MEYPIKTPEQLGAVLKGFRRERQLTQATAGSRAGLAQNAVSEMEANPGRTSFLRLLKLLSALDVELVVRNRKPAAKSSEW